MHRARHRREAFSLLELLVVIGLITALSAIAAPKVITLFKGRAIAQAYNTIDGAFQEAHSRAVSTRRDTAVFIAFRSHTDQPVAKVWVVDGGTSDNDTTGPLAGLMIDERDMVGANYDDVIISEHDLPPTVFVHGLCWGPLLAAQKSNPGGDSSSSENFTRWYCIFDSNGTCKIVKPDGDGGTNGQAGNWKATNDFLPVPYDEVGGTSAVDSDITLHKVLPDFFEDAFDQNYDFKLSDTVDEIFVHIQPSTGKLVKRSSIDTK